MFYALKTVPRQINVGRRKGRKILIIITFLMLGNHYSRVRFCYAAVGDAHPASKDKF